jgi:chemosensory pili system protein ChpC
MKIRKKQAIESKVAREMVSMLLPVSNKQLMLPSVALAEVVPLPVIETVRDCPNWLMGMAVWRDLKIPIISYEGINDEPFAPTDVGRQLAVFNGLKDVEKLPFYGVALQGMPRMTRISEEDVRENDELVKGVAEAMAIFSEGSPALIPDLDYIESQLLTAL